ncbi:MAG: hydrogenase 4 subunit F [Chloroflexota bacterium]
MILLLLLIVPLLAGIGCFVVRSRRVMDGITMLSAAILLVLGLVVAAQVLSSDSISLFGAFFYADALSSVVILVIVTVGFTTSLFSIGYMRHQPATETLSTRSLDSYYVLFHAFMLAMLIVPVANSLGIMWMAIEATTLASALLVALYGTPEALEAAWKYVIVASVGIALALFAVVLTYYAGIHALGAGNSDLNWTTLMPAAARLDPRIMKLVFILALIGFGTKAGLAPMHTWLPDAHSEAPVPISALLSGVLLSLALYAILRFYALAVRALGHPYPSHLLLAFGLFSLLIAMLFILRQTDYKRLLAYSSVEHMGIIATGFAFGGPLATYGALLQMLNHAIVKSLMFFAVGNVLLKYGSKDIKDVSGLIRVNPFAAATFVIGGFALIGSPPFNTFISELAIFAGGFKSGNATATVIMIIFLAVIFVGFMQYVNSMVFGVKPARILVSATNSWIVAAFVCGLIPIIVLGLYVPGALNDLVRHAALVLGT